jgi:colanic acid biosynthesis glycosyl transferase WcaI
MRSEGAVEARNGTVKDSRSQLSVLIYGVNYAPESTGIPKYTGELGAWLAQEGHRVDAVAGLPHYPEWTIAANYRGKGFHRETVEGVTVHRTPLLVPRHPVTAGQRIRLELSFLINSARYWVPILFRRQKFDVVVAICPGLTSGIFPWIYHRLRGVPWVLHVQDFQVDAALGLRVLRYPLIKRALLGLESFLLERATRVSTISVAMRQRAVEKGVPECDLWDVPNWADTRAVSPEPRDNAFRRMTGADGNATLVQCAGSMGEKQGLEVVLQAADRLRDEPSVRFAFVGDGSARERIRIHADRMALENVVFLPRQPRASLPEMLAAADIHLITQRAEAADLVMPSRLANILASGRPSIVTASPGTELHRVVTQNGVGRVCAPGDAEGLARCILELAGDAESRRALGNNARRYATTFLEKELILSDFSGKLRNLVAGKREKKRCLNRAPAA